MNAARLISILLPAFWLVVSCSPMLCGQQREWFGGKGIAAQKDHEVESKPGLQWPKLLDFSTEKTAGDERFRLFGPMGSVFGPKRDSFWKTGIDAEVDSEHRPGFLTGFSSLLPAREPGQPNFLQRMNTRSKDLVQRTTSWAQKKNQNLRALNFRTWDSLTKNLPRSSKGQANPPHRGLPMPSRTADNLEGRSSVRF